MDSNNPSGILKAYQNGLIQFPPGQNNLRLVLTKEHVPAALSASGQPYFVDEYKKAGIFQGWGSTYEEFTNGAVQISTAIVERLDGAVVEIPPSWLKFVNANNLTDLEKTYLDDQFKKFAPDDAGQK